MSRNFIWGNIWLQHAKEMGKYWVGWGDFRAFILGQGVQDVVSKFGQIYFTRIANMMRNHAE